MPAAVERPDARTAHQEWLIGTIRNHRPVPQTLEGFSAIAADGHTDRGVERDRFAPRESRIISANLVLIPDHRHGIRSELIERPAFPEAQNGLFADSLKILRRFALSTSMKEI